MKLRPHHAQTMAPGKYPTIIGFAVGWVVEAGGKTMFMITLGRTTWRWMIRDTKIEPGEKA